MVLILKIILRYIFFLQTTTRKIKSTWQILTNPFFLIYITYSNILLTPLWRIKKIDLLFFVINYYCYTFSFIIIVEIVDIVFLFLTWNYFWFCICVRQEMAGIITSKIIKTKSEKKEDEKHEKMTRRKK